ncbi:MAG TPA: MFS transporter [Nitrospiraceae bacterium]|nr:MFS transporter [Nitrospiraceae bacterium]
MARFQDVLPSVTDAEPDEAVPVGWAFLYFFCLLCGYYILRPVRDEMAIEGGVQHLPWMMTATFVTLLLVTPLFGWLSARVPRYRLLVIIYTFFGLHLVWFFVAMMGHISPQWTARAFFVWLSVFNLFVVSIFWSVMADVFTPAQGARLFGVIAAGGSIGAMVGPLLTTGLTYLIPVPVLLLISVGFLVACVVCVYQLDRWARAQTSRQTSLQGEPIGGSIWAGVRLAFSSPYLSGICLYLFFLTTTATFLYLEQMRLVSEQISSPEGRTRLFALIDLVVNVLTFLTQVAVTSRVISRFGLASALIALPIASAIGFGMIGLLPLLTVYVFFTIVRRVGEYALAKPAREVLFTVVSREEKYKAKNFIDTAVSRGGDAMTGWIVNGVKMLGVTAGQIVWVLIPLALLWGWVGWFLARQEQKLRGG